jgi:HSP20 family molecular chaperone IbpA
LEACGKHSARRKIHKEFSMFFATHTLPSLRRYAYSPAGRSLERFLDDTLLATRQNAGSFEQDDKSFTLTFDVPGIAKDQLAIGIEGAIVRITAKEGAPRQYKAAYELPQDIDPAGSEAKLDNGVLTLKLAKKVVVSAATELAVN